MKNLSLRKTDPPPAGKGKAQRSIFQKLAAVPHAFWTVLFIAAPMLFVLYFAFTDTEGNFSFSNIADLGQYTNVFILSIAFALIATALLDNGGLLNSLLGKLGLEPLSIVGSYFGVILGMVYDFLPYMVLPIFTAMTKLDYRYIEASHDLGCNAFQTMTKVVMPLTLSGVVSGVTMVFVPSISTFYISQKLGAGKIDLVGDTIERLFQNVSTYNVGAAMSLVMMILILISLTIMNKFSDEEGGMVP